MENDGKVRDEPEIDPLFLMEDILDKLKILDYETYFLKQK